MIRSKLTATKREITAKDTLIKKLQKENLVLKQGSNQSEVWSMRRLLAVIRSKLRKFKISHERKFKISHAHLVQKLKREKGKTMHAFRNQVKQIIIYFNQSAILMY